MTHIIALADYRRQNIMQTMFRASYFLKQVLRTKKLDSGRRQITDHHASTKGVHLFSLWPLPLTSWPQNQIKYISVPICTYVVNLVKFPRAAWRYCVYKHVTPSATMTCRGSHCDKGRHFITWCGPATDPVNTTSSLISVLCRAFVWNRAGARPFAAAVSVTPFIR